MSRFYRVLTTVFKYAHFHEFRHFKTVHTTSFVCENECPSLGQLETVQIKNIKLHIVTDIKVNFNSMLGFRISLFGWGEGKFYISKKLAQLHATMFATLHGANNFVGTKPCACLVLDFSNKT